MKYLNYIFSVLTAAAVGAVIGSVYQTTRNYNIFRQNNPVIETNKTNSSYVIRDCDGMLALYRGNAEKPFMILEYKTSFLNEYDRSLVSEGISVPDSRAMRILIEDLTG